jgi:integrase
MLAEIQAGLFEEPSPNKHSATDLWELIRTDYRLNQRKSIKRLEASLKHLDSYFGGMKVSQINTKTINAYTIWRLEKGAGSGTVNRELTALKRALNLAKIEGYIKSIPYVKMLKEPAPRQGFLEHDQYLAILNNLPFYLKPLFMLAYITGMRRGELLSLTWDMVNMKEHSIHLRADLTKTGESRTIFLPPEGTYALKLAMKNRVLGCDFVFNRRGKPIGSFYKSWRRACDAAGCPGILFHDCRRTAIRNLVRAGVPERVAMEISGHRTRAVFDRYNITSERDLKEAAIKLGDYLSRSQENTNAHDQEEGR